MTKSNSPQHYSQRLPRFTRQDRRLILFISSLAIALVLAFAFGFAGRTVKAQKSGDRPEGALINKADFLLRESYRAARAIKRQPASQIDAQSNRRIEEQIRGLSKVIEVKSEKTGSVRVSVAVRLVSSDTSELTAAGFSIGSKIDDIVTIETDADRLAELALLSSVRKISAAVRQHKLNDKARQAVSIDNALGQRVLTQTGRGVVVGIVDTGIDFRHSTNLVER